MLAALTLVIGLLQLVVLWFIWQKITWLERKETNFMASASQALTDIQTATASELTVEQSAITLIQQLAAKVTAANGVSPDAVEAVVAQINANAAALAAAVTANTPAPPATT